MLVILSKKDGFLNVRQENHGMHDEHTHRAGVYPEPYAVRGFKKSRLEQAKFLQKLCLKEKRKTIKTS